MGKGRQGSRPNTTGNSYAEGGLVPGWPARWSAWPSVILQLWCPQATAETVYDILSPASPISRSLQDKRSSRKLRKGQQPADLREGMAKAYDAVREVRTTLVPRPAAPSPLSC